MAIANQTLPSGCSVTGHYTHITIAILLGFSGIVALADAYPNPQPMIVGIGLIAYSIVGTIYSIKGIRKIRNYEALQQQRKMDSTILELSISNKGVLNPAAVSIALEITIEEAKQVLDNYVERGIAELEVTQDGKLLYKFPEPTN